MYDSGGKEEVESVNVERARELKREAERAIENILNEYHKVTGMMPDRLVMYEELGDGAAEYHIDLQVRL